MRFDPGLRPRCLTFHLVIVFLAAACGPSGVHGQTPTFTGLGQLSGGTGSKLFGVSADGTMVVGEAVNSSGKTGVVIYDRTGVQTLVSLGFLNGTNQESHGTDIGIDSLGVVHVCGTSKNNANTNRAYHWAGTRLGVGSFTAINPLTGGPPGSDSQANDANGLYINSGDEVFITGQTLNTDTRNVAYRYRTGSGGSVLSLGYLNGTTPQSRGMAIGTQGAAMYIAGYANSRWGGGANAREAFRWDSTSAMAAMKGLDWICGGEPWQISAEDGLGNHTADTTRNADNPQVLPVGLQNLFEPDSIVISAGHDNQLKDQLNPAAGDRNWPEPIAHSPSGSESLYNAISPNGRYMAGRSTYPGAPPGDFEADLRDIHNRDYSGSDNCGGIGFNWPLGFLPGHDYSEALGVSNGAGYDRPLGRTGLVVVGYSGLFSNVAGTKNAFACLIKDDHDYSTRGGVAHDYDLWFLQSTDEDGTAGHDGAAAASRFKGMKDIRAWLVSTGTDMTGWILREARAVSDDGKVIVGWGEHNGVNEGFIVTIEPPPPTGGCCVQTGFSTGTCSLQTQVDCGTQGGSYLGDGTLCGANNSNCDFCPTPFGDADGDTDVDQDDFAVFQKCYTGPGSGIPAGCACFDRDPTNPSGIDQYDFAAFKNCVTGPKVPFDPQNPPPGCVP